MSNYPLLPADRYIADLLGLTEEQYRYYIAEVRRRAAAGPQPSVVAIGPDWWIYALVISSLLSTGFSIAASFFKPKMQRQPELRQIQTQGQSTSDIRRYTPRQGFDSVQDVASIGTPIPLVYAKRELIGSDYYGGIRVNCPLIWSEVTALDKGQLLRAMFMIGEGASGFAIDVNNLAIGNNPLGSYLLGGNDAARFTIYYRANGGRIISANRVAGAATDPGAAADDNVFAVPNQTGANSSNFCHTHRPSTQTQFGVYAMIGNGLGYRINPLLRPGVNAQITVDVKGKKKKAKAEGRVVCEPDLVALAQRQKQKAKFSGRSGLIGNAGNVWTYHLSNTTDALTVFTADLSELSWTKTIFLFENPFSGITDATLASWLTVGSVTVSSSTLSASVSFNTVSAESGLSGVPDGTYIIEYGITLNQADREILWTSESGSGYIVTVSKSPLLDEFGDRIGSSFSFSGTGATISIATNARESAETHEERCGDVAAAVAGRQKTWDDAIQIGELYKIGSYLAVCTERSPTDDSFNSDADFEPITPSQGNVLEAKFRTISSGSASAVSLSNLIKDGKSNPVFTTATNYPHVYRVAIASFSTLRECRIVKICIRSSLGIRISGLCNFRDTLTHTQIDGKACYNKEGNKIPPGDYLTVDIFNSGQMSSSEERYSFFRIRYREAGLDGSYVDLGQCFGIRGITQQSMFNDIRLTMPSTKRWEFQIVPLSGWEIRSGVAAGDLELIDGGIKTVRSFTSGQVGVAFYGARLVTNSNRAAQGPALFRLASAQRGGLGEVGIGYADGDSYLDYWGKLAEAFVYEEVKSSADNGPEHEVVSINEYIDNPEIPLYDNLGIIGLSMRSGVEWQQFGQLSTYVTSGLQNTHLFPEILKDLFTNTRYGKGDQITDQQIDLDSFTASASWCETHKYFFDGAITANTNLRQWAADVSAAHLLFFGEAGGRFWLRPAWPGTVASPSAVAIKGIFSAGNIKENTFSMEFMEPEDRRPIQVSVRYREERISANLANPGLFAVEREVLVREQAPNGSDTAPIESVDLSDYVTNKQHAIDAAKFIIRMRRIPEHAVKFETTHEGIVASIQPGDYIKVALDINYYDELRNGVVLVDGSLVSTQPFANGTYTVLAWDPTDSSVPAQITLTVSNNGKTASPSGIIFTLINSETRSRTYQIEKISPVQEGGFSIEAVHMPVNSSGILKLAEGFTNSSNWSIQG
jgi:hypothetical protein